MYWTNMSLRRPSAGRGEGIKKQFQIPSRGRAEPFRTAGSRAANSAMPNRDAAKPPASAGEGDPQGLKAQRFRWRGNDTAKTVPSRDHPSSGLLHPPHKAHGTRAVPCYKYFRAVVTSRRHVNHAVATS